MDERTAPWRDSARPIRLGPFDARLLILAGLWIFWPSWTTTALLLLALAAFRMAEVRGMRLRAALRAVRARLAGRRRACMPFRARRFADFGG